MTRLRILKQRALRTGNIGICKLNKGYVVVSGTSFYDGYCSEIMTYREAVQHAARCALPQKDVPIEIIVGGKIDKS